MQLMTGSYLPAMFQVVRSEKVVDIESAIPDSTMDQKNLERVLDKTRGFVKYKRATYQYRDATKRFQDWGEIFDHKQVKDGLRMQAAR